MKKLILLVIIGLLVAQGFSQKLNVVIVTLEQNDTTYLRTVGVDFIQENESPAFYFNDSICPAKDFIINLYAVHKKTKKIIEIVEATGRYVEVLVQETGEYRLNPKVALVFANNYEELSSAVDFEKYFFNWPENIDFEKRFDIGMLLDGEKHIEETILYERINGENIPVKVIF